MDDDWGQEILLIPNGTTSWWPENFEQERLGLSGAGSILTGYVRMKDGDFKDPSAELLKHTINDFNLERTLSRFWSAADNFKVDY